MGSHFGNWKGYGVEGWLRDGELNEELGVFGKDLELRNRRLGEGVMRKLGETQRIKPLYVFGLERERNRRIGCGFVCLLVN